MRIAVSSDEYGHVVDVILRELTERGHETVYYGPRAGDDSVDWPEVTLRAAQDVAETRADEAVVMCWTGTGCSIVANKIPGIRAALCVDAETARGARIWNHANVLALSLRSTSEAIVLSLIHI